MQNNNEENTTHSNDHSLTQNNQLTDVASSNRQALTMVQNFLADVGINRRSLVANQYKLLIILSQILIAKGIDNMRACPGPALCPVFSSMDYYLYVSDCFEDLRYGSWSPCKCPSDAESVYEKITPKILGQECGPVLTNNFTSCFNTLYEYTIGEFQHIVFMRRSATTNDSYEMFENCVVKLIDEAYEEQKFPWAVLGYAALGVVGACALGVGLCYGKKYLTKWYDEHRAQQQIETRSQQHMFDETSPLFKL